MAPAARVQDWGVPTGAHHWCPPAGQLGNCTAAHEHTAPSGHSAGGRKDRLHQRPGSGAPDKAGNGHGRFLNPSLLRRRLHRCRRLTK